jgi:hypothetical protein
MIFLLIVFLGFSWGVWYVGYARLNDQLRLLRSDRAKELSQLAERVQKLEAQDWSKNTLREDVSYLKRRVRDLQFPLTEEERLKFEETKEERERIAQETGCDPRDVIVTYDDYKRYHFDDRYFADRRKAQAETLRQETPRQDTAPPTQETD